MCLRVMVSFCESFRWFSGRVDNWCCSVVLFSMVRLLWLFVRIFVVIGFGVRYR